MNQPPTLLKEAAEQVATKASLHNTVFLTQHDGPSTIYRAPRSTLLVSAVCALTTARNGPIHGFICLNSHCEVGRVVELFSNDSPHPPHDLALESRSNFDVDTLGSHADMIELRQSVREKWKEDSRQVFVVSSNCLLYILCLGLLKLSKIDFIIFENITTANHRHPCCIIMEVPNWNFCGLPSFNSHSIFHLWPKCL